MIDISISSYGTSQIGNRNASSSNIKKKKKQDDCLMFIGNYKCMYNGFFNDRFKYKRISEKPVKAVYEI